MNIKSNSLELVVVRGEFLRNEREQLEQSRRLFERAIQHAADSATHQEIVDALAEADYLITRQRVSQIVAKEDAL